MLSNKALEKHYFEMFSKDYQLPSGKISYKDKPDVIIRGEKKIGIEMTQFYLEDGKLQESEQRQKALRQKIISSAQSTYQVRNKEKIELTLGFDKANPIENTKIVISKLVALAEKVKKCETGEVARNSFKSIPELSFVYLYAEEDFDPKWKTAQLYHGAPMSRNGLIEIVRGKEESSKQYETCDSFWLLVVIHSMDRAQDQEIKIDNFKKIESTIFEKIIVYKTHFGDVLEAN